MRDTCDKCEKKLKTPICIVIYKPDYKGELSPTYFFGCPKHLREYLDKELGGK